MPAEQLSPLVRRILAPNPSPWTLEGTNTYLIGSRRPLVLDPGPLAPEHLEHVLRESGPISGILITHRHPDHAEGLERFMEISGAALITHQHIPVGATSLRRIATPGHSSDHESFLLEDENALFSGDHVLGRGTTVVVHPDGNMRDYMHSLDEVIALAPSKIYPGHGPVVEDPASVLAFYRQHRLARQAKIKAALDAVGKPLEDVLRAAYDDVTPEVLPAAKMSLLAHLSKLAEDGEAVESPGGWALS